MSELKQQIPLCVDLDGSLTYSDLLLESLVRVVKNHPWMIFLLPLWLLKGKAYFKARVAQQAEIEIAYLPYNEQLLNYLKQQFGQQRKIILVTGSNEKYAKAIAKHFHFFSDYIASNDTCNLTGKNKADRLVETYGEGGFDYAGNESADYCVWRKARHVIVVNATAQVIRQAQKIDLQATIIPRRSLGFFRFLKAIRVYQWVKNILVFVPLLSAQRLYDIPSDTKALIAFLAFSFCASFSYIINDLFDLDADRGHTEKRYRPLASGAVTIKQGLFLAVCLAFAFIICMLLLDKVFSMVLVLYFFTTTFYSFYLKRKPLLDVFTLAGLYTLRVIGGAAAIGVLVSFWLLAFSIFIFLSLALMKRVSELVMLQAEHKAEAKGRDYQVSDMRVLDSMGVSSGYASVLVLALYLNSDNVVGVFDHPIVLWLFCPMVLYWISRMWLRALRGEIQGDPIVAALKDCHTQYLGMIGLGLLVATFTL